MDSSGRLTRLRWQFFEFGFDFVYYAGVNHRAYDALLFENNW